MSKGEAWKSQQILAKEMGVSIQVMCNWVRRGNTKIKSKKDKNTGLTLVKKNILSIPVRVSA